MLLALLLLLSLPMASDAPPLDGSMPNAIAERYAQKDTAGLDRLRARTASTGDDLLVRYRLYPLTQDTRLLDELPDEAACTSARDLALLSALWAYRVTEAPAWRIPALGRRADGLLDRARSLDSSDPFVLLVEGQSLLYRPALFGGSASRALDRFTTLRDRLREHPEPGLPLIEAEVWVWYTLTRLDRSGTDALRDRLLAQNPPPLYREFLLSPP